MSIHSVRYVQRPVPHGKSHKHYAPKILFIGEKFSQLTDLNNDIEKITIHEQ